MDYRTLFYLLLGMVSASIALSIGNWFLRRRFIRYFGRNATQAGVDGRLMAMAEPLDIFRRYQRACAKGFLAGMSESIDLEEKSPERKKAEKDAKKLLEDSLDWKWVFRESQRMFRRAQRLAKHFGFTVQKDYTDYLNR